MNRIDWRKNATLKYGTPVYINGLGDLGCDGSVNQYIGKICEVIKLTKAGLVYVKLIEDSRRKFSVPKKNVTIIR